MFLEMKLKIAPSTLKSTTSMNTELSTDGNHDYKKTEEEEGNFQKFEDEYYNLMDLFQTNGII